jgi:hypothetical protein
MNTCTAAKKPILASPCLSAHLSVSPYVSVQLQLDRFLGNLILEAFRKTVKEPQIW